MPALKARAPAVSTSTRVASASTSTGPSSASTSVTTNAPSRATANTADSDDDDIYLSKPYQPGFTLASMMHEQALESVTTAIATLEQMREKLNFLLEFDSKSFGTRYKRVDDKGQ